MNTLADSRIVNKRGIWETSIGGSPVSCRNNLNNRLLGIMGFCPGLAFIEFICQCSWAVARYKNCRSFLEDCLLPSVYRLSVLRTLYCFAYRGMNIFKFSERLYQICHHER